MRTTRVGAPGTAVRHPGPTAVLLALTAVRRAPLLATLALLARAGVGAAGPATSRPGAGDAERALVRWTVGIAAARLLASAALVPAALLGSLVLVLGVVLVLAGGITVVARVSGLG